MAWFRLHTSVLNNPKIQKLSGDAVKVWLNMLCLAKEGDGVIPTIDRVAWALRRTEPQIEKSLAELAELIHRNDDGTFQPHDWNAHQYKSDVSTPRVKAFRETARKRFMEQPETTKNGFGNGGETPRARTEQSRTDSEQIQTAETETSSPSLGKISKTVTNRGSRFSASIIGPDWQEYAAGPKHRWPQSRIDRELEKFANYWGSKSGKDATKMDWAATWRTWVINGSERQPEPEQAPALFTGAISGPKPLPLNAFEDYALMLMRTQLMDENADLAPDIRAKVEQGRIKPEREAELWAMAKKAAA